MSLKTLVLKEAATLAVTGGTDLAFGSLGITNGTKNVLYATADEDVRTRREITFNVTKAKVNPDTPNGYTQPRSSFTMKVPKVLANTNSTVNTFRGELSTDVETSVAEKVELIKLSAQTMISAITADFWQDGSVD